MFICLLYILETGRVTLKPGALPTMKLPPKSVETPKFTERCQIIKTVIESKKSHFPYKAFLDFTRQVIKKKSGKRQMHISEENKLTFKYFSNPCLMPKFQIIIDENLEFTLSPYDWLLPDDHEFYKLLKRTVRNSEMHRIFSETGVEVTPVLKDDIHDLMKK